MTITKLIVECKALLLWDQHSQRLSFLFLTTHAYVIVCMHADCFQQSHWFCNAVIIINVKGL